MDAGDICDDCALIGEPGALCPKHAAADDMVALLQACRPLLVLLAAKMNGPPEVLSTIRAINSLVESQP